MVGRLADRLGLKKLKAGRARQVAGVDIGTTSMKVCLLKRTGEGGLAGMAGTRGSIEEDAQGRGLLFKRGDFINKNLCILDMLDDKVIPAYKLMGDIHNISLGIPLQ